MQSFDWPSIFVAVVSSEDWQLDSRLFVGIVGIYILTGHGQVTVVPIT